MKRIEFTDEASRDAAIVEQEALGLVLYGTHTNADRASGYLDFQTAQENAKYIERLNKRALELSDSNMARVSEDLVQVLIGKGVITLEDLPEGARQRILSRQALRDKITGM